MLNYKSQSGKYGCIINAPKAGLVEGELVSLGREERVELYNVEPSNNSFSLILEGEQRGQGVSVKGAGREVLAMDLQGNGSVTLVSGLEEGSLIKGWGYDRRKAKYFKIEGGRLVSSNAMEWAMKA